MDEIEEGKDDDEEKLEDEKKVEKKEKENRYPKKEVKIIDLFKDEATQTSQGYKLNCPDCGPQGGRTEGFILFPESNTAFCHTSNKWFTLLEAYALKKKIIRCLDGNEKGEDKRKILGGELFTLTLDEFKNEYGTDTYNKLINDLCIRKSIELPGNNKLMSDFSDELGDVYKTRNVLFFRGELREIVEIHRYKKVNDEGKEYIENGFKKVDGNRFITLAEMFIKPWTIIFTKSGIPMHVTKSMTQSTSNIALASPNLQNKMPIIARIFDIQIPILHNDKLTFPKKGYDRRFGSWLPYNAPQIKEGMFTLEESKTMIDKIFEEFCFASDKDRTHAVAAFITPFLRGIFPKFSTRTPVFIYMANRERAGKDYCAGCAGVLYEGSNIEEPAISNDERGGSNNNEEIRKKIMACMMQGKKRFHSANNKGLINNSVLEGVTTAEIWSDRILGRSENVTFNNEMDYSLSANIGTRLTPDLANRARIVNLHLVDEDANARDFKNPRLHEWIYENRGAIISALYTLVENWMKNGKKKGSVPFTSFPQWASVCGGIMESAGYDNPCKTDKSAIISLDNETEEMKLLFEACFRNAPEKWLGKGDIQAIIEKEGIMSELDFNNKSDQIKFGLKIDKFINRALSEILMRVDSLEERSSRRKFKFTKNINVLMGGWGVGLTKIANQIDKVLQNVDNVGQNINEVLQNVEIVGQKNINGDMGIDKVLQKIDKVGQNFGNVCNVGNDCTPVGLHYSEPYTGVETLPKLPTLPNPKINDVGQKVNNVLQNLSDFSEKYKNFLKKEEKEQHIKEHKKVKTDRELQFYESPETAEIVEKCSQEAVMGWVYENPGKSFEALYSEMGDGCFKHIENLMSENLIRPLNDGWEVNVDV